MDDLLDGWDTFDWEHDTIGEDEVRVPETEYVGPADEPLDRRMSKAQRLLDEEELVTHRIEVEDFNEGRELLFMRLEEDLRQVAPTLAFSSSKAECLSAVEELKEAFGKVLKGRRDRFVEYWKKYNSQVEAIKALDRRLARDKEELGNALDDRTVRKLGDIAHQSRYEFNRQADVESMRQGEYDDFKIRALELLQERVADLSKEQSRKPGDSVSVPRNPFAEHLNRKHGNLRPVVELEKGVKRSKIDISPEVASMIFSYSDVESCVQLREVSSFWYTSFQQAEAVLELVVRRRSPWMHLSGDLLSWRDCTLVFVKRLSSGKWKPTDLHEFQLPEGDNTVKMLTATVMDNGEKLPANFHGIDAQKDYKPDYTETRELLEFDDGQGYMDLKTLRKVRAECDVQVPVIIRSSHDLAKQVGNVIMGKPNNNNECQILHYDVDEENYADFGTSPGGTTFMAFYNGLIWWHTRRHSVEHYGRPREGVFPTFVDMNDGKVYHRQDRSIHLPGEEMWVRPHQCTREPRFLLAEYDRGLKLADLSTGSVTDLRNPDKMADETEEDGMGVYVFPGIVGDNFDVRSMAPWTVYEYERDAEDGDGESDEGESDEDDEGEDDEADGDDDDGDDDDVIDLSDDVIDLTGDD